MASSRGRLGYYYGWNVVGVTVLAQLASFGIAINCLSLYLPEWSRDLHAPVSALAFCYTAPGTVFCLLGPLTGYAADRFSVRWMITLGLLGVAGLFALASQVTQAWQLIALFSTIAPISMVVAGFVPCQVLVTRWFERRRGAAIGFSALGQTMAGAVLPPILAIALPTLGWRALFLIIAVFIAVLCAPIAWLLIRDRPSTAERAGFEFATAPAAVTGAASMTTRAILAQPNFWILGVCSVATGFLSAGFLVNLAPMAASEQLAPAQAASLLSILCLTALAAKLVTGFLIDRLGGRLVLAAILAMGAAGVIVVQLIPGYLGLLIGTLLIASSSASIVPIATTVAREFGAESVGRVMGLITFLGVIAVTAPPIVAFMNEITGGYHAPLVMLAVMGVVSSLAAVLLNERKAATLLAPA